MAAQVEGDHRRAEQLHAESLALTRETGDRDLLKWALVGRGNVAVYQGDVTQGKARFEEVLALAQETGDRRMIAFSLDGLAAVCRSPLRAAHLLGAADALRADLQVTLSPIDSRFQQHVLNAVRAHLNAAAFTAAWAAGRAMSLEQAIAYALEDDSMA